MQNERVVIVGAGVAGGNAATALRELGDDRPISLIGHEPHAPYNRPPLSKSYLRGETDRPAARVSPEDYWIDSDVQLLTGTAVSALDLAASRVEFADGRTLPFGTLVLATGVEPLRPAMPGGELDGILTLRTFEDADRIRTSAAQAERILVVGDGWIGSEVAASLRLLGRTVTLALPRSLPLARSVGAEIAEIYAGLHRQHGVIVRTSARIVAFDGAGSVQRAQTESGEWIDTDLVVLAIGVSPRLELARTAGLTVGNGVVVDGQLRSSDPRVFAVGDGALVPYPHLGRALRVEHWGAAVSQGQHVARSLQGRDEAYSELPYVFSDQYDTGMEFWGDPERPGELVVRGELESRSFTAFWHDSGRVSAVMNMHVHHHHHHDELAENNASHVHGPGAADGRDHAEAGETVGEPSHPRLAHVPEATPEAAHSGGHLDPEQVIQLIRSRRLVAAGALGDPDVPLGTFLG